MKIGSVDIASFTVTTAKASGLIPQNQSVRVNDAAANPAPGPASSEAVSGGQGSEGPVVEKGHPGNNRKSGYGVSSRTSRQAVREAAEDITGQQLSRQERAELTTLKQRDRAVRSHEQAHRAAGAGLVTGATSYSYERGPDGKRYAVGGEVQIDTSKESTPQATIIKMSKVKRAALAPADPSAQDQRVAAAADKQMTRARQEVNPGEGTGQQVDRPSIDLVV